jgi:hypothetical protein
MRLEPTGKSGFSLIEALIAMVVMVFILGAVGILYFTSFRVWQRCSAQSQADPPAHLAIGRITKELKNASAVTTIAANSLSFTLPATTLVQNPYNGSEYIKVNVLPLTPARQISYYLSDATGAAGGSGTMLWRSEQNLITGASNLKHIADNVEELNFDYDAAGERVLKIYAMSVTVQGKEGRQVHRSEFGSHVAFRNGAS